MEGGCQMEGCSNGNAIIVNQIIHEWNLIIVLTLVTFQCQQDLRRPFTLPRRARTLKASCLVILERKQHFSDYIAIVAYSKDRQGVLWFATCNYTSLWLAQVTSRAELVGQDGIPTRVFHMEGTSIYHEDQTSSRSEGDTCLRQGCLITRT